MIVIKKEEKFILVIKDKKINKSKKKIITKISTRETLKEGIRKTDRKKCVVIEPRKSVNRKNKRKIRGKREETFDKNIEKNLYVL